MKRILILLLLLSCFGTSSWGQDAMQQAEEFYRQGKFSAALGIYESELKKLPNDPYLYYNIGNCYFKMGSRGLAAANFYRAFRLAPRDAEIRRNLTLTLESSGERFVPSGIPVILHEAFFYATYPELKGLFFVFLWLFCALASVWLIKRKFGKMLLASIALLLLVGSWFYIRHTIEKQHLAVIASPVAEIRSGPGTNFPASASVAQGHLITVEDEKDTWYEVIVKSQGLKGWVEKSAVEPI